MRRLETMQETVDFVEAAWIKAAIADATEKENNQVTDADFQNKYNAAYWHHFSPEVLAFCGITFNPNDGNAGITNPQPPNTVEDQPARFQAAKDLEAKGFILDFQIHVLLNPVLWTMWQRTADGCPYVYSFGSGINPTGQPVPALSYPPGTLPTAPVDLSDYEQSLISLSLYYPALAPPPPPLPSSNPIGARQPWTAIEKPEHTLIATPASQGGLPVYACAPAGVPYAEGDLYIDPDTAIEYRKVIWLIEAGEFTRTTMLWLGIS